MGLPLSLNFRGTTAFKADGGGESCVPESNDTTSGLGGTLYDGIYAVSGVHMGWIDNANTGHYDRSTTPAAKFAGFATIAGGTAAREFRIDLPNADYTIAFAAGSYTALGWSATWTITFHDGATAGALFSLSSIPSSGGNSFTDHNDALKTDSTWSNASPRTVTITNGYLRIKIGDGANTFSGAISHVEIAAVSPYVSSFSKPMWPMSFF